MNINELTSDFYIAFNNTDHVKMNALYHKDCTFEDPAFGKLKGNRVKAMWQMLCESQKGKDFKISYKINSISENNVSVYWEANYTYSKTKRKVTNKVTTNLTFKDGLIIEHVDFFSLYQWSIQAFGMVGLLLGWTTYFKKKIQLKTNMFLDNFIEKQS